LVRKKFFGDDLIRKIEIQNLKDTEDSFSPIRALLCQIPLILPVVAV
jgi:hypothetical protein